ISADKSRKRRKDLNWGTDSSLTRCSIFCADSVRAPRAIILAEEEMSIKTAHAEEKRPPCSSGRHVCFFNLRQRTDLTKSLERSEEAFAKSRRPVLPPRSARRANRDGGI